MTGSEPPPSAANDAAVPDSTRRRPPRPRPRRRRSQIPFTIRYLLPLAVLVVAGLALRDAWVDSRIYGRLTGPGGEPLVVDAVRVEMFVADDAPNAPSPTAPVGEPFELAPGAFSLDREQVPQRVLCRLTAPGCGDGVGSLDPDRKDLELELGPARPVTGHVQGPGGVGVAGAEVTILGGGSRGVVLATTRTDAAGTFVVDNVASTVRSWGIRVDAEGFALQNREWFAEDPLEPEPLVELETTQPAGGRLVAFGEGAPDMGGRVLRFFHVPGLTVTTDAEGRFAVPNLPPPPLRTAVLVPDLPPGWTLRRTRIAAGETDSEVAIRPAATLHGRVVNGYGGRGVPDCLVYHEHGPLGLESTRTDAEGRFTLERVPEGVVEVFAYHRVLKSTLPPGVYAERPTRFADIQANARTTVVLGREPEELFLELR